MSLLIMQGFTAFTQEQIDEINRFVNFRNNDRPLIYCELLYSKLSDSADCIIDYDSNTHMYQEFNVAELPSMQKVVFIPMLKYQGRYIEIHTKPIDWDKIAGDNELSDFNFTLSEDTVKEVMHSFV